MRPVMVIRYFSLAQKILSVFPPFGAAFQSESIMVSRSADIVSVEQFIEDQENENTKKKTQQNVTLLKGISDAEERVKTYGRNSPKGASFAVI